MNYLVFSFKKTACALVILVFLIYTKSQIPNTVHAQSIDIGVFPPIIQISAKPPASVVAPMSIENFSDQTIAFNISYRSFKPSPKANGDIEFTNDNLPVFEKVQVFENGHTTSQVTLAPKQKKDLEFHVGLTGDEKSQDYYFSVLFISNETQNNRETNSQALGGIATNVLLTVGDTGPTRGSIEDFSAPFFVNKGPIPFKAKVKNTSNHYITPSAIITVKNIFSQTVGKVDLLPVNILSGSSRIIPAPKELSVNDPKASWNEKFLLGIYTAHLTVGLSEEGPILSKTTTFLAFPVELLAGLLVSLGIVAIIVKRVREKQSTES